MWRAVRQLSLWAWIGTAPIFPAACEPAAVTEPGYKRNGGEQERRQDERCARGWITVSVEPVPAHLASTCELAWGNKWGNTPHRLQPFSTWFDRANSA